MMGEKIMDPFGIEGSIPEIEGLGILPIETTMAQEKLTIQSKFKFLNYKDNCEGYEIHMGVSTPTKEVQALNKKDDNSSEGVFLNNKCWGSYFHGILDNKVVIDYLLNRITSYNVCYTKLLRFRLNG